MSTMEDPASQPYLTATLEAPQADFDLSGATPFHLRIIATLHAQGPVLCYVADTFLWPPTALREQGIGFKKLGRHPQPVPRPYVSVNYGDSTERPWDPDHCLFLQPEEPIYIEIPFSSLKRQGTGAPPAGFDVRLWVTTSGFETCSSYEATLPAACMVSWWRRASPDEMIGHGQRKTDGSTTLLFGGKTSLMSKDEIDAGVPVLPKEQQMVVLSSRDKVVFTCLGRLVEPPRQNH